MHQRVGPERIEEADGLPGVRGAMHARESAGCADGVR